MNFTNKMSVVSIFSILYISTINSSFCKTIDEKVINCPVSSLKYVDNSNNKIFIANGYSEKWIILNGSKYGRWTLRGLFNGNIVYLSYFIDKAAPCCGFISENKLNINKYKWKKGPILKNLLRWGDLDDVSIKSLTINDIDQYGSGPLKGFTLVPVHCQNSEQSNVDLSTQKIPPNYMANTSKYLQNLPKTVVEDNKTSEPKKVDTLYRWQKGVAMEGTLIGTIENIKGSILRLSCTTGTQLKPPSLWYSPNNNSLQSNERIQIVVDDNAYHFSLDLNKDLNGSEAELSTLGSRLKFGSLSSALANSSSKEFLVEIPRLNFSETFSLKDAQKVLRDEFKGKIGTIVDQCL